MPNSQTDAVFSLVKSLTKGEKRFFRLYVSRNAEAADAKFLRLFRLLDNMVVYDESKILKKEKTISAAQLSNLKAHLYNELLVALRLLHSGKNIDIQIREQIDFARLLYNRGLISQSLKQLDKVKALAMSSSHFVLALEILEFEKLIEARHITRSIKGRAEKLAAETDYILKHIDEVSRLSNLSLQMYGLYLENGHVRNENESKEIRKFFEKRVKGIQFSQASFFGQVYLHQSYCWYYFIQLDFARYYRHSKKWVTLFEKHPAAKKNDPLLYLKAIHNLLNALFMTGRHEPLKMEIQKLEEIYQKEADQGENFLAQAFVYLYTSKLNLHFLEGSFKDGIRIVAGIERDLKFFKRYIDVHRVMVFYYKIGCLYFGAGDNNNCILYLSKIIHFKVGHLRSDIQCFARILHLIAHYEAGNTDILEHLLKSTYRFLARMEDMDEVQLAILKFLRRSLSPRVNDTKKEFSDLREELRKLAKNKYASRSYQYLDILSWLESKQQNQAVGEIIRKKFLEKKGGNNEP